MNLPTLTEQEAKSPVTWGDMNILIEEIFKSVSEVKRLENNEIDNAIGKILDAIVDQLKDIRYQQFRDTRFFICLLSDLGYGSTEYLTQYYNKWCKEFDQLNKEVEKDVSKTNC